MGLVGYRGQKVSPFVMFGFSRMRVKASYSGVERPAGRPLAPYDARDNATLKGWKLATGIEFPFSDKLVGLVLLHYADYGKATFTPFSNAQFDRILKKVKQTSIRFGIGYTF